MVAAGAFPACAICSPSRSLDYSDTLPGPNSTAAPAIQYDQVLPPLVQRTMTLPIHLISAELQCSRIPGEQLVEEGRLGEVRAPKITGFGDGHFVVSVPALE